MNARAVAFPRPLAPPVTRATLPSRLQICDEVSKRDESEPCKLQTKQKIDVTSVHMGWKWNYWTNAHHVCFRMCFNNALLVSIHMLEY